MVTYRVVARFFFEGPPRLDMAHRPPMAHRAPAPEPLYLRIAFWVDVAVLIVGFAVIAYVLFVLVPE